jgi:hypothetical protein
MKSFKEIAELYSKQLDEAKLKKLKKFVPDEKGNLKKIIKKECHDKDGKAEGWKVQGTKCVKQSNEEQRNRIKGQKSAVKKKAMLKNKYDKKAAKVLKKRVAKGLIDDPTKDEE